MNHKHVVALLLALKAAMAVDLPVNGLGNIVAAAAAAAAINKDAGLEVCSSAYNAMTYCHDLPGLTAAPEATQAACLCCESSTKIDHVYSSCASFLEEFLETPESSSAYLLNSGAATVCADKGITCGAGDGRGAATRGTATSAPSPTGDGIAPPPACISVVNIASSCSEENPDIVTMYDDDVASCVCYTDRGASSAFTTALDDYASSCAVWAKTADPSDYSVFHALEGFCASYATTTGDTSATSATSVTSDSRSTITSATDASPTETDSDSTSPRRTTTVLRTATPTPDLAIRAIAGEPLAWTASMLSLVLSFFFLA